MRFIKITLTLALLCTAIFAQQKDCKNASTNMERVFCSEPELVEMDKKVGELYNRIKASNGTIDQEEFESKKKDCTDIECLKKLYKAQIPVLTKKAEAAEAEAEAKEAKWAEEEEKEEVFNQEIKRKLIFIALGMLILLVFYIIAFVKLKRGDNIVPVAGWFDFILMILAVCSLSLGISMLLFINNIETDVENYTYICFTAIAIGGLCFLGSMAFSITKNKGNPFNIIVSIFAKMFLVFLGIIIFLYVKSTIRSNRIKANKGEMGRWEERDRATIALAAGIGFFTCLSLGLIKR